MYKGSVSFVADITSNGLTFPRLDFNPHKQGVDRVEIEGVGGHVIRSTVYLTSVQSREAGRCLAAEVNTAALNRIAFCENVVIENARMHEVNLSSLDAGGHCLVADTGEYALTFHNVATIVGRCPEHIKGELEQQTAAGERYYGLFRSARQSTGPIEEFMHLYQILLMLYQDKQAQVDAFICAADSDVPQTQHPRKRQGVMETVYSRLRNEFAHGRQGLDVGQTKAEMMQRLPDLRMLTRQAIEQDASQSQGAGSAEPEQR